MKRADSRVKLTEINQKNADSKVSIFRPERYITPRAVRIHA